MSLLFLILFSILGLLVGYFSGKLLGNHPSCIDVPTLTSFHETKLRVQQARNATHFKCGTLIASSPEESKPIKGVQFDTSVIYDYLRDREERFPGIVFADTLQDGLLVAPSSFSPPPSSRNTKVPSRCKHMYVFTLSRRDSGCLFLGPLHSSYEPFDSEPSLHSYRVIGQNKASGMKPKDSKSPTGVSERREIVPGLMEKLPTIGEKLKKHLDRVVGNRKETGGKKEVIVMVSNDGMIDLLLNFACSAKRYNIDISNIVVFTTSYETMKDLQRIGFPAFYDEAFGAMPSRAAGAYGDMTFMKMMVLKLLSVYLTLQSGYDVLFQDADLVWFHDPITPLLADPSLRDVDIFMMDDGARSNRYHPFFGNSGFYYMRNTPVMRRMMYQFFIDLEIVVKSHSHQESMLQVIGDMHRTNDLSIHILDDKPYPQGKVFHRKKDIMQRFMEGKLDPLLFHMCWTANRENKLRYFKNIGMWYIKDECSASGSQLIGVKEAILKKTSFEEIPFDKDQITPLSMERISVCCSALDDDKYYQPAKGYKGADISS